MKKNKNKLGLSAAALTTALLPTASQAHDIEDYESLIRACSDTLVYTTNKEECTQAEQCITTPNAPQCTPLLDSAFAKSITEGNFNIYSDETTNESLGSPLLADVDEFPVDSTSPTPLTDAIITANKNRANTTTDTTLEDTVNQASVQISKSFDELNRVEEINEFINTYFKDPEARKTLLDVALRMAENTSWTAHPVVHGKAVSTPVFDPVSGEPLYFIMQIDPKKGVVSGAKQQGTPVGSDHARLSSLLVDILKFKPKTITDEIIPDSWRVGYSCLDVLGNKTKRDRFKSALTYEQRKTLADAINNGLPCKVSLAATDPTLIQVAPGDIIYKGDKLKAQITVNGKRIHQGDSVIVPAARHLITPTGHINILTYSAVAIRESAMLRAGLYNISEINITNPVIERVREVKDNKPIVVAYSEAFTAVVDSLEDLVARAILLDPEGKPITVEESDHRFELRGNELLFYANPQTVGTYTVDSIVVDDKGFKTKIHIAYKAEMPQDTKERRGRDAVRRAVDDYVFNQFGVFYAHRFGSQPHPTFGISYDRGLALLSLGVEASVGWRNTTEPQADQITVYEQQNATNQGTPVLLDEGERVIRSVIEDTVHNEYRSVSLGARLGIPLGDHVSIIGVAGIEHKRHDENHEGQITDYFNNGQTSSIGLDLDKMHKSNAFYHGVVLSVTGNKGRGVDFGYGGSVNKNGHFDMSVILGVHRRFGGNKK